MDSITKQLSPDSQAYIAKVPLNWDTFHLKAYLTDVDIKEIIVSCLGYCPLRDAPEKVRNCTTRTGFH